MISSNVTICRLLAVLATVLVAGHLTAEPTERSALPSAEEKQRAREEIDGVFKDRFERARTSDEKQRLANDVLDSALETRDDEAVRFVLLRDAYQLALETGDVEQVMKIVAITSSQFELDELTARAVALKGVSKNARQPFVFATIARKSIVLLEQSIASDRFDVADGIAAIATTAAKRSRDKELQSKASGLQRDLPQLKTRYEKASEAKTTLESRPDDPNANLAVARYYWLNKNEFQDALPYLAISGVSGLQAAAELELIAVDSTEAEVSRGDAWWHLSEEEIDDGLKEKAQSRATHWYEKALPNTSGFTRQRLVQRIDSLKSKDGVDLLANLDIARHSVAGPWEVSDGTLMANKPPPFSRITLPTTIKRAGYSLSIEFTTAFERIQENQGFDVILPVGERSCLFVITPMTSGIARVNGETFTANDAAIKHPPIGRGRHRLDIKVNVRGDNAEISSNLDGVKFVRWQGPQRALSLSGKWQLAQKNSLGVGASLSSIAIHDIRLREFDQ